MTKLPATQQESLTYLGGKRSISSVAPAGDSGNEALVFLTDLAKQLSRGPLDLPCFPNVVIRIREALKNPDTSTEKTVTLVGSEPLLAARLIKTANSVAFNPTGKRVTELRTAVTRLGQQVVQGAAVAFAIQQMKDEPNLRSIARPLSELWKNSIAVASLCQVIAMRTKVNPDEAFLAGLLHGIGRLYILVQAVASSNRVRQELSAPEFVADWHPSIGKAVLENWQVGEAIAQAVNDQADVDRTTRRDPDLTDVLIVSVFLAKVLAENAPRVIRVGDFESFRRVGLSAGDCAVILRQSEYQLASLQEALGS
jgi:HD-like signal output (HDOD) protein